MIDLAQGVCRRAFPVVFLFVSACGGRADPEAAPPRRPRQHRPTETTITSVTRESGLWGFGRNGDSDVGDRD